MIITDVGPPLFHHDESGRPLLTFHLAKGLPEDLAPDILGDIDSKHFYVGMGVMAQFDLIVFAGRVALRHSCGHESPGHDSPDLIELVEWSARHLIAGCQTFGDHHLNVPVSHLTHLSGTIARLASQVAGQQKILDSLARGLAPPTPDPVVLPPDQVTRGFSAAHPEAALPRRHPGATFLDTPGAPGARVPAGPEILPTPAGIDLVPEGVRDQVVAAGFFSPTGEPLCGADGGPSRDVRCGLIPGHTMGHEGIHETRDGAFRVSW